MNSLFQQAFSWFQWRACKPGSLIKVKSPKTVGPQAEVELKPDHIFPKVHDIFFFFFLLFWSHIARPAGRLSQVSIWNRRTPPLSSRRRPGHSKNTLPSSPPHRCISADATPVTARRRRRQRTSADTENSHRSPPPPALKLTGVH